MIYYRVVNNNESEIRALWILFCIVVGGVPAAKQSGNSFTLF